MPRTISGSYTSTQFLSNPAADNPATVTATGVVEVADADGIFGAAGYPWTLTNLGTIALLGTAGNGVHLTAGGTVTNGQIGSAGISITAPAAGVEITGAAGTVNNFGRISGPTPNGVGVLLELGGSVTNGAIGAGAPLISGAYNGIFAAAGAASIVNFGRIEAPGSIFNGGRAANVAVFLGAGGIVQNGTDGSTAATIEGYHMGVFSGPLGDSVTISNFGTIAATGTHTNDAAGASGPEAGVGILLGAPDPVIRNGSSSTTSALIQGYYRGIGAGYYGTATVVNFGTIESTQTGLPVRYFGVAIVLHNGGTIANYGLIKGAQNGVWTSAGGTLGAPGTIDNFGTIEATSGFAVINGRDLLPSAVALFNGGTVTNDGLIRSGWNGVVLTNTAGSVVNTGTIQSTATSPSPAGVPAAGVILASGGIVINGANGATDALIQAYQTGVYGGGLAGNSTPGAGTVTNYGTIAGIGSTAANGVVLVAGGTVSNSGTISSAAGDGFGVKLSAAGFLSNTAGALITSVGNAVSIGGSASTGVTVTNSGNITGNVGIAIAADDAGNNTIVNDGTITGTSGIAIDLGGGNDLIIIHSGSQLFGAVADFTPGDAFDLPFLTFSTSGVVTLGANNVLQIIDNGTSFDIALDPNDDFTGHVFQLSADPTGGTRITVEASVSPPYLISDPLMRNDQGTLVFDHLANGQSTFQTTGAIGPEWSFGGSGYLLGPGRAGFLLRNTDGAVVVGEVVNGSAVFTTVAGLGAEWEFGGNADFLGTGQSQFLIRNADGLLAVGEVVNDAAQYTIIGGIGPEWQFAGNGNFLGDAREEFLIRNTDGLLAVGEVINGVAEYTIIGGLGSEWAFKGVGDFLGSGYDGFLIRNTGDVIGGALLVGEVVNGTTTFTDIGGVGPEWEFIGTGNYSGDPNSDFALRHTATGELVVGSVAGNATNYTFVGGVGSEWDFLGKNPALLPRGP